MQDIELGKLKKNHKKALKKNDDDMLVIKKIKIDPSPVQNGLSTLQVLGIVGVIVLGIVLAAYSAIAASVFVYQYYNTYSPFFSTTLPAMQASINATNEDIIQIKKDLILLANALNITLNDNDTYILSYFIYDQTQNKTQDQINAAVQSVLSTLTANYAAQQIVLNGLNNNISTIFVDFLNQQLQLNTVLNNISFLITQNNVLQITIDGLTFNVSNLITNFFLQQSINTGVNNNLTTIFVSLANQLIINNGFSNNFTTIFSSLANQLIINNGVNNNFTTIFNFILSQQLLNAGYNTLQAQINNITMAATNNFTLSSNVFDVPRGKSQQSINDDFYATKTKVDNGNISADAVFDSNFGESQSFLNAIFNTSLNTPSGLNFSSVTTSLTLTGPWPVTHATIFVCEKLGNWVTLRFPTFFSGGLFNTLITTSSGSIPAGYRPSIGSMTFFISVISSGIMGGVEGTIEVNTDGTVSFGVSDNTVNPPYTSIHQPFPISGANTGFYVSSVTYSIS